MNGANPGKRVRQRNAREKKSYNIVVSDSVPFPAFRKPSVVEALFNRAFGFRLASESLQATCSSYRCAGARLDAFTRHL